MADYMSFDDAASEIKSNDGSIQAEVESDVDD